MRCRHSPEEVLSFTPGTMGRPLDQSQPGYSGASVKILFITLQTRRCAEMLVFMQRVMFNLLMIFTDNKLFPFQTDNCVIFIGIYGSQEPGDVWRRTGGHKVAPAPDYYDIQVNCCLHCLIVCLAHFDNFHNEQQSERKIQGLTTNQSGSCRRKKLPKTVIFF